MDPTKVPGAPEVSATATREEVELEVAPIPEQVLAAQANRAQAMALLAAMPEWWKDKFRRVAQEHFGSRRARRAVAKLLREFRSWAKNLALTHQRQLAERDDRARALELRIAKRALYGKAPLRGISPEVVGEPAQEAEAAASE